LPRYRRNKALTWSSQTPRGKGTAKDGENGFFDVKWQERAKEIIDRRKSPNMKQEALKE
jgi:hypothetical protein